MHTHSTIAAPVTCQTETVPVSLLPAPLQPPCSAPLTLIKTRRTHKRVRRCDHSTVTAAAASLCDCAPPLNRWTRYRALLVLPAAVLEATLTNLRTKLTDLESDK